MIECIHTLLSLDDADNIKSKKRLVVDITPFYINKKRKTVTTLILNWFLKNDPYPNLIDVGRVNNINMDRFVFKTISIVALSCLQGQYYLIAEKLFL